MPSRHCYLRRKKRSLKYSPSSTVKFTKLAHVRASHCTTLLTIELTGSATRCWKKCLRPPPCCGVAFAVAASAGAGGGGLDSSSAISLCTYTGACSHTEHHGTCQFAMPRLRCNTQSNHVTLVRPSLTLLSTVRMASML